MSYVWPGLPVWDEGGTVTVGLDLVQRGEVCHPFGHAVMYCTANC